MRLSKYSIELGVALSNQFPLNLDDYPIFDESYRQTLNDKIVRHYWFHEIGFETWDRFAHYLEVAMYEEMPYFNQLYKSELLKIDPLLTFSRTRTQSTLSTDSSTETATGNKTDNATVTDNGTVSETGTTTDNGTINNTNNTTSTGQSENNSTASQDNKTESDRTMSKVDNTEVLGVRSDTPPSNLTSIDAALNTHATEATKNTGENSSTENDATQSKESTASQSTTVANNTDTTTATNNTTNTNTTNTTNATTNANTEVTAATTAESINKTATKENTMSDTSDEHGFEVSQAELLLKYRETFLNIDMMVIDKIKDLFMAIY